MLFENSDGRFDERPENKTEQFLFRFPFFVAKIVERLLHGLTKLIPESPGIEVEESSVESPNYSLFTHGLQTSSGKVFALVPG